MNTKPVRYGLAAILLLLLFFSGKPARPSFAAFLKAFPDEYARLGIPDMAYDYKEYFATIPAAGKLDEQTAFFEKKKTALAAYPKEKLKPEEQVSFDHLLYEISFNLERLALEKAWVAGGRKIPEGGLYALENRKGWYSFFIKRFTSLNLGPEEIKALGEREVKRVQAEINRIRLETGFTDSLAFVRYLGDERFIIRDKDKLLAAFARTDSTIRKNLLPFTGEAVLPPVVPMEWPDAGPNTPPGMYINHNNNPYGKDVFQYNFYGGQFNSRAIDWLYMHEAIPGHHMQWAMRKADPLRDLFLYPGNFEGWACYVEYFGTELGVMEDPYSRLGKWEWDLVRSARLVIETGIHYYGWTRQQALDYWHKTIPAQDAIAEREVTRVTNWPAQAISYKAGADCLMAIKAEMKKKYGTAFNEARFHRCYLSFGMCPLEVVKQHFDKMYSLKKTF